MYTYTYVHCCCSLTSHYDLYTCVHNTGYNSMYTAQSFFCSFFNWLNRPLTILDFWKRKEERA